MSRPGIVTAEPIALPRHELLARVFRTLGDATRLQLLEVLLEVGQATQSELLEWVDVSQSRVSEHLGCLAWCGFIAAERQGRTVRYQVIDGRAADLVEMARCFLDDNEAAVGCCTVLEGD
ncbi:MAG: metalloregulator ArsR/SmtB family transcription factor [Actinobacteria bacterium]|nr:metalloregulator ArsR/SmtB family transcription factor [Actinomycetota bacterium]